MRTLASYWPLLVASLVLAACQVAYALAGVTPSPTIDLVWSMSLGLILINWIVLDARRRGCVPCHDFGFLMGVFVPVSLVWYPFWSRGWRGVFQLIGVVAILVVPTVVAVSAVFMLRGAR